MTRSAIPALAVLMHFTDPRELGGLHVIGSNDVARGVVNGIYTGIRSGYPQWAAIQSGLFGTDVSIIPLYATELQRQRALSGTPTRPLGLLAAAADVTVAAVHPMVLDESGCSRISFSCHSACEF